MAVSERGSLPVIETGRLRLVPASLALARAELSNHHALERLLNATVPGNWPPETLADALPLFVSWLEAAPEQTGWYQWYALARLEDGALLVLVGGGGFLGPPREGAVELGYSILPQFQGRGYATELVMGLSRWALAQPCVSRVVAETEWANPASARVLTKAGFAPSGQAKVAGGARYELRSGE